MPDNSRRRTIIIVLAQYRKLRMSQCNSPETEIHPFYSDDIMLFAAYTSGYLLTERLELKVS